MANKMMRVLSFLMVAMLAFCLMGLTVSAEQEIPVIEEVSADELATVEEEVELYAEVPEPAATDYFQVLTGETHKGYYADLGTAYAAAADGDTIKMLKNYEYGTKISLSGKSVTIDGGGYVFKDTYIRNGAHDFSSSVVIEKGTLTFKNINITAAATTAETSHTQGFITINDKGKVIYDAGTKVYNYLGTNGAAIWCNANTAVAEILEGAEITNCTSGTQGVVGVYQGTVYIKGGSITNNSGTAVGMTQSVGKLYISGGTITGTSSVDVGKSAGTAEISGNAIIGNMASSGGTLLIKSNFTGSAGIKSTDKYITGITLEEAADVDKLVSKHATYGVTTVEKNGVINVVWDCVATINDEKCYANLHSAVSAINTTDGSQVIYMKKDDLNWMQPNPNVAISGNDHLDVSSNRVVTIEGNGHTLSGNLGTSGSHYFIVAYTGAKVTIRNLTIDGNGKKGVVNVHYNGQKAGTAITFENCIIKNANRVNACGGTLNVINTTFKDMVSDTMITTAYGTSYANQENQINIKGCTFEGSAKTKNAIYIGGAGAKVNIGASDNGTKTTIKNINGTLGAGISVQGGCGTVTIDNLVVENCKAVKEAAGALYIGSPATITNSTFKNNSSEKGGGAIFIAGSGTTVTGCTFNGNTATIETQAGGSVYVNGNATFTDCTFTNGSAANGGAVFVASGKTATLKGTNTITGNTANAEGGAIYLQGSAKLDIAGKLNISGNKKSNNTTNNIFMENAAMINVTGAVDEESVIGVRKVLSASTIATAVDTSYVNPDVFKADDAPSGVTVSGSYFPETVGDGKLNGVTVIDMTEVSERAEGRDEEIVLHWPWMVVRANGAEYGAASLLTAYENRGDGVIYAQKPMTVEYQWGDELTSENYNDNHKKVFATTEFPMWMPNSTNGVVTDVNHTDISGGDFYIDGNGHVIDAERNTINSVFVIYGSTTHLQVDNFIYDGEGGKPFATLPNNKSVNNLTGGFYANNSYLANGNQNVVSGYYNGTININDSTVAGKITVGRGATLNLLNTTVKNSSGTAVDTATSYAADGVVATITVDGETFINESNVNVNLIANISELVIEKDFAGKLGVHLGVNDSGKLQIVAGEGFDGTLESIEIITKDGTNGATFAYYDADENEFAWASLPELGVATDAGAYTKETGKIGVIRFATTFTKVTEGSVASYGTYALGTNNFDSNIEEGSKGLASFNVAPAAGKTYFVDVIDIPEENFDSNVYAINFVYFKGIENPWFNSVAAKTVNTATDRVKDLGEYPVTEA